MSTSYGNINNQGKPDSPSGVNKNIISSITQGPRQSNIELLRIVAMLLVLIVHADYLSLGTPSASDFSDSPLSALCRVFLLSLSIICVNLFILISGWFQIRPTIKGGLNFIFQCLWMSVVVMIGAYFMGVLKAGSIKEIFVLISQELFFNDGGFWFIKAYLILYTISPVLNTFMQYSKKQTIIITLMMFFTLQSIWSPLAGFTTGFYKMGFSPLSFIGLYLLANTVHRFYADKYTMRQAFVLFLVPLSLLFVIGSFSYWQDISIPYALFVYSNPLVICESLGLLMIFARLRVKTNNFINWVSSSAFAIYLVHINPLVLPKFIDFVKYIFYHTYSIMTLLAIFAFIVLVFLAGVILDQPRKMIWRWISENIPF